MNECIRGRSCTLGSRKSYSWMDQFSFNGMSLPHSAALLLHHYSLLWTKTKQTGWGGMQLRVRTFDSMHKTLIPPYKQKPHSLSSILSPDSSCLWTSAAHHCSHRSEPCIRRWPIYIQWFHSSHFFLWSQGCFQLLSQNGKENNSKIDSAYVLNNILPNTLLSQLQSLVYN